MASESHIGNHEAMEPWNHSGDHGEPLLVLVGLSGAVNGSG